MSNSLHHQLADELSWPSSEADPVPITPKHCWHMMKENTNVRLVDIRSTQEFLFVGHPIGALHIPWLDEPDWVPNAAFVDQVRSVISEVEGDSQHPLMLICRSGERSNEVGQLLSRAGLVNIFSVTDGFEGPLNQNNHRSQVAGWRSEGLPWEQC